MRLIRGLVLFLIVSVGASSCFNPPEYSIKPQIEFESIEYKEYGSGVFNSEIDSLILKIKFKDGDGDLGFGGIEDENLCFAPERVEVAPGLFENHICFQNKKYRLLQGTDNSYGLLDLNQSCTDNNLCFNNKFYLVKESGSGQFEYITYKDKRTNPAFATFPEFVKPYNCINWQVRTENNLTDTLYFELNPDHYNITVDFLVKNPSTLIFEEFDWTKEFAYPNCGPTFDGRFPILFKDNAGSPLEGELKYIMQSTGFKLAFSIKTLKLRIQIKDRALNLSNVIETPEFTLQ